MISKDEVKLKGDLLVSDTSLSSAVIIALYQRYDDIRTTVISRLYLNERCLYAFVEQQETIALEWPRSGLQTRATHEPYLDQISAKL